MRNKIKNNNIVKGNQLITASYDLTLQEQRLILAVLGKYDQTDDFPRECILTAYEFADLFQNIKLNYYKELIKAVNLLYDRDIKYIDESSKQGRFRFVSSIIYDEVKSEVVIGWSPEIMPYISQLKEQFTQYKVKDVIKLKSVHAIRLFELIQQKYTIGEMVVSIEDLKKMLQLENKYTKFWEFKQWVIYPALKEIFLKLNLPVDFTAEKAGRSYKYLRFTWEDHLFTPNNFKITSVTHLSK